MENGIEKLGSSTPMTIVDLKFPSSDNYWKRILISIPSIFSKKGEQFF